MQLKFYNLNFAYNFRIGLKIGGCIKLCDSALGSIIFTEIGIASFNFALSSYYTVTFYTLFSIDFSWVVLVFIIGQTIEVVLASLKIWQLTLACENINDGMVLVKDSLQNYQVLSIVFKGTASPCG